MTAVGRSITPPSPLRVLLLPLFLFAPLDVAPSPAQSLSVGDEVIYSGGPSQPPQSKQTGLSLNAKIVGMAGSSGEEALTTGEAEGPIGSDGFGTTRSGRDVPGSSPSPPPKVDLGDVDDEGLRLHLAAADAALRAAACRVFAERATVARDERVAEMRRALFDDAPAVVAQAARALGRLNDGESREDLEELLDQDDPALVDAALGALGDLGDSRSLPALRKLERVGDPRWAKALDGVISRLRGEAR